MLANGIRTISDLKSMANDQLPRIRGIQSMHKNALEHALPSSSSADTVDHRKSENPYQSRYGDKWEEQLKSCPALSPFRPITNMVNFMTEELHRLKQGPAHKGNCFFWHDSLSLLTSNEWMRYMKRTDCYGMSVYDRWLKPLNDVNINTAYHGRYVGNSPEFMPLDNSLNFDL